MVWYGMVWYGIRTHGIANDIALSQSACPLLVMVTTTAWHKK